MKKIKVMVFGTFDGLHRGHLSFFRQAKKLSRNSFLIVLIARDKNVLKVKNRKTVFLEKERVTLVKKCKLADKVVLGSLNNYFSVILKEEPDIIALGYDQKFYTKELRKEIKRKKMNVKIIRLKSYKKDIYKSSLLNVS